MAEIVRDLAFQELKWCELNETPNILHCLRELCLECRFSFEKCETCRGSLRLSLGFRARKSEFANM